MAFYGQPAYPGAQQRKSPSANPLAAFAAPFFAPGSQQHLPAWFQSVDTDRSGRINVNELQVRRRDHAEEA
jgi:hypothetical protein